jgi:hypothetical protein
VATSTKVKAAQGGDGTPSESEIARVSVGEGDCPRPEIESGGGPRTILEVAA